MTRDVRYVRKGLQCVTLMADDVGVSSTNVINSCIQSILARGVICTMRELHARVCNELHDPSITDTTILGVVQGLVQDKVILADRQDPPRYHAIGGGNMPNETLLAILEQVESAVDSTPGLTRLRPSGFVEAATFTFGQHGWTVRLEVRNKAARGRGSRGFYSAQGDGESPEAAASSFIARLPFFVQVTS